MNLDLLNDQIDQLQRLKIGEQLAHKGDARAGVGLTKDNLPDIVWCSVKGSDFVFDERHFSIPDFQIAKYPITFIQFDAFVQADDGYANPQWWQDFPSEYQHQPLLEQNQAISNHPRDRLSWFQAVAFSRWLNSHYDQEQIRLPYEWEWQWAAQGGEQKLEFPFGDWQSNHANTSESQLNRSIAVGMYPKGAAPCGALDMAGNVWEWCLNDYENIEMVDYASGAKKVRRGGSYNFDQTFARNDNRDIVKPETRSSFNGMRLVRALG